MSYCRFSWEGSEVYVIESRGGIECCGCKLEESGFICDSPELMIHHLAHHKRAGHFVPPDAVASLWEEIEGPNSPTFPEPQSISDANAMMAKLDLSYVIVPGVES